MIILSFLFFITQRVDVENKVIIIHKNGQIKTQNSTITVHPSLHVENNLGIVLLTALKILFTFQMHNAIKILKLHHKYLMGGDIVSFEINANDKTILIFGSAGFNNKMKIPKKVDILIWPFQGRTNMTKYSLPIIEKIKPKTIILDHFDNAFPPITGKVNTEKFVKVMTQKHPEIKIIVPKYKEKIIIE